MIRIEGKVATYGEIWFDEEVPNDQSVDVLIYRQRPKPVENHASSTFLTLVTDLQADDNALAAGFGNTNRYKIKRADTKDALDAELVSEPLSCIDAFCEFYDAFARHKALESSYRRGLTAAAHAGQLVLTMARRDREVLIWHAYIRQGSTAALLHSASHFREKASIDRAMLGRANRWLHWRDMLGLRKLGVTQYDWGGLFEDETIPEHAGVNRFKYDFGGRRKLTYNCTVPLTMKGRFFLSFQQALDRLPKRRR